MPGSRRVLRLRRVAAAVRRRARRAGAVLRRPPQDVALPPPPEVPDAPVRLVIGPANFANQGWEWARAVERARPDVAAVVVAVRNERLDFPADYPVPDTVYRSPSWAKAQSRWVTEHFTHVLIDGVRPLTGWMPGARRDVATSADVAAFRAAGLKVGLVAHGSEVRRPSLHRELYPYSPFEPDHELTANYENQAARFAGVMTRDPGPTFVSTPDLLDFVPGAAWLPVVVHPEQWRSDHPVLERERPVVVHVPSMPFLKGSDRVDPVLARMHDQGRIEYRRLEGIPSKEMPGVLADADVVLDQFVIGCYGVMAVQAMCAGRLVVAHVAQHVRERLPDDLPVVESGPADVEAVLEDVLADRQRYRSVAAHGVTYAAEVHDGRRAAAVLDPFLASG